MEFRLLGDVEARAGGRVLDIGPARQRCVLVAMLIDVNRLVSSDQLIERVWSDELPHRARNSLAGYLSRLRQALGEPWCADHAPVRWLCADDGSVVDRSAHVSAAGGPGARRDRGRRRRRIVRHRDGMWRGVPFASLDTPWMNDVRTALEAERFAVALDRNDAALRVGRHGELLPAACRVVVGPSARRTAGRAADACPVPLRQTGRRAGDLSTDARTARRGVGNRPGTRIATGAPADPRRRSRTSGVDACATCAGGRPARVRPCPAGSPASLGANVRYPASSTRSPTARW